MKIFFLVCAVCLNLGESYGLDNTEGVGAFSYNGPDGRYSGTYGLRDGQVVNKQGNFPPNFSPPPFLDPEQFFPDYFDNLQNILQEAFIRPSPFIRLSPFRRPFSKPFFKRTFDTVDNQKLAYVAAMKAFDLTTNRAASNQYFAPSRFPFGGHFPGFDGFPGQGFPGQGFSGQGFSGQGYSGQGFSGPDMSNYGRSGNSAYAGAAIGPEYTHQVAEINPANPSNPNINKFSNIGAQPSGFKSVSSSSFATSSDINGHKQGTRRAETTINDNGVITKYKVEN